MNGIKIEIFIAMCATLVVGDSGTYQAPGGACQNSGTCTAPNTCTVSRSYQAYLEINLILFIIVHITMEWNALSRSAMHSSMSKWRHLYTFEYMHM